MARVRTPFLSYQSAGPKQREFHASTAPITIAIGAVVSGKTYMACAELLRHLLCTEEGRGKSAIVVSHTHTHTRDQMVPIFQAILDNKVKGQQKGIALNEYKLLRSAPMQICFFKILEELLPVVATFSVTIRRPRPVTTTTTCRMRWLRNERNTTRRARRLADHRRAAPFQPLAERKSRSLGHPCSLNPRSRALRCRSAIRWRSCGL
jgi:hypothetical protein